MHFSAPTPPTPLHSTHSTELFKIFFSLLTLSTAFLQKACGPGKNTIRRAVRSFDHVEEKRATSRAVQTNRATITVLIVTLIYIIFNLPLCILYMMYLYPYVEYIYPGTLFSRLLLPDTAGERSLYSCDTYKFYYSSYITLRKTFFVFVNKKSQLSLKAAEVFNS